MSTVQFQIKSAHVQHFLAEKAKGVCVEAINLNTQETGWLYVGHNYCWNKHKDLLSNKITWVVSCFLKDNNLSPFEGGNANQLVKTEYSNGILAATIESRQQISYSSAPTELPEGLNLYSVGGKRSGSMYSSITRRIHYYIERDNLFYEVSREDYDCF
jgi:hypothetical protein